MLKELEYEIVDGKLPKRAWLDLVTKKTGIVACGCEQNPFCCKRLVQISTQAERLKIQECGGLVVKMSGEEMRVKCGLLFYDCFRRKEKYSLGRLKGVFKRRGWGISES